MIKEWAKQVIEDEYFLELFKKAEEYSISKLFGTNNIVFTEKEYNDLFRFSDILSFSDKSEDKNLSLKIVSLLYEIEDFFSAFKIYSVSILTRLGNFPSIKFIDNEGTIEKEIPFDIFISKKFKEENQVSPFGDKVFTDSQYKIYKELLNHNNFSFSGPTSLGKSFLIESYIFEIAKAKKENIVLIVPTRALINQVSNKLKTEFKDRLEKYKILTHPVVPDLLYSKENNFIFIFTPERFITYLGNKNNPKISYLFVDEAHKVISENDSRSPLYYHALYQAQKKGINLFFASPNLPNPDIFLKVFGASPEDNLTVTETTVTQNRYFIDLVQRNITYYSDLGNEYNIENNSIFLKSTFEIIRELGNNTKNIIYCNTVQNTINYSLKFSKLLNDVSDEEKLIQINKLIDLIKKELHEYYYLIPCLKKGIGFHFGAIPQRIRNMIEQLFQDKAISYIFTTSTLLEGINLPAKNIFILNNKIGLNKFKSIDFWNLAGRAGRLTKELSGNIICIREDINEWVKDYTSKAVDHDIIKNKKIEKLESQVIKGGNNFYKNINNSISGENFTKKDFSSTEKEIWDHYGNILLYHHKKGFDSNLITNYTKKLKDNSKLEKIAKEVSVPDDLLLISSNIKVKYQNNIYKNNEQTYEAFPNEISYDNCKMLLKKLYKDYNFKEEESCGKKAMFPDYISHDKKIEYYATIMEKWLNSASLKKIISSTIKYKQEKDGLIYINQIFETFDKNNPIHINQIINDLMNDIDYVLRYKLEKYFNNYYLILVEKLGENNAGSNWAEFLEYGTNNKKMIELQNLGIERHLAKYLLDNFQDYIKYDDFEKLTSFEYEKILEKINIKDIEHEEFQNFINSFID
ncbi:DEAD/DEAH box helicase [Candidatus Gracilibacteria bacterium]|nr:DEAD/DEAH box helicase [Candidatus Gracilibacteria bacterium]